MNSKALDAPDTAPRLKLSARLTPAGRRKLVQRLWLAAEAQVQEIEGRLASIEPGSAGFERDARDLGLLAKFLKELVSLETQLAENKALKTSAKPKIEDEDAPPRNLEQFRDELTRRLDALHRSRQPDNSTEPVGATLAGHASG